MRRPSFLPAWRPTPVGLAALAVLAAALLAAIVWAPPHVGAAYEAVSQWGPAWATAYLVAVGLLLVLFAAATGGIVWRLWQAGRQRARDRLRRDASARDLPPDEVERQIAENLAEAQRSRDAPGLDPAVARELADAAAQLGDKRQAQELEIVAFGTVSSGKSSLLNALAGRDVFLTDIRGGTTVARNEVAWPTADRVTLVDTPGLAEANHTGLAQAAVQAARDADLLLLVVDGPLRENEFALLEQLAAMEKRLLLCLNKEDWYDDHERASLLGQLREQVRRHVPADDVLTVRARAGERTRVRVLSSGEETTERVPVPADIAPLAARMQAVLARDGRELLLANLLLQSRGLVEQAREKVRASLDQRAWRIVDRHMWLAGAAAAVTPFPVVDVAAGCAVSTLMVMELAKVYERRLDLEDAKQLVAEMGKNLVGILGANLAAPAVATAVASVVKTVPGVGLLVGGALQGLVQALITRWMGAVFIAQFRDELQRPEGGLPGVARREWERLTQPVELWKLVQEGRRRLTGLGEKDGGE